MSDGERAGDEKPFGVDLDGEDGFGAGREGEVTRPSHRPHHDGVVVGGDTSEERAALERLSYYLDELFVVPGTSYRIGLDPLVGLVPGVGDVTTSAASAYIVARAAALGVPRATLARMLLILLVDAVFGSLPLVGDAFDAAWKANTRNVRLLESRLDAPEQGKEDRRYVLVVTAALTLVLVLVGVSVFVGAWWLLGRFGVV